MYMCMHVVVHCTFTYTCTSTCIYTCIYNVHVRDRRCWRSHVKYTLYMYIHVYVSLSTVVLSI